MNRGVDWTAGGSYNLIGVNVPVAYLHGQERLEGDNQARDRRRKARRDRAQLQRQRLDDFEAHSMSAPIDGFYSVYMSGKHGQGFAMLVFTRGRIVGADEYAFVFDGQYCELGGDSISVSLLMKAPSNVPLIQGGATDPHGEEERVNFQMPRNFTSQKFIRVETHRGPVNVRLVKLRDINEWRTLQKPVC